MERKWKKHYVVGLANIDDIKRLCSLEQREKHLKIELKYIRHVDIKSTEWPAFGASDR